MRSSPIAMLCMFLAAMCLCASVTAQETKAAKHIMVSLKNVEPRALATMKHQGPFTEVPDVMAKLMAEVKKGDYLIAGPPMTMYFNSPQEVVAKDLLWEVWIPVVYPGKIGGREHDVLTFKALDALFVASTYHVGPYEKVGDTYEELFKWIQKNKYPITGNPVEVYWGDPENTPQDKLVTEIWMPIGQREAPPAIK